MQISYFSMTDKGITRDHNEDSFLNNEKYAVFMVADGMGGFQLGDVASRVALSGILSYLELNSGETGKFSEKIFRNAVQYANRTVYNLKNADPSIKTIGTTLVCFIPGDEGGHAFNIGDSRLYRFRSGKILQITEDHSLEQKLPDFMKGLGDGKFSSILSRAVGTHETVEIDVFPFDYEKGDIILLCSDGLYSMVNGTEMSKILSEKSSLKNKCEKLTALANKNGGQDNITVTLAEILDSGTPGVLEIKN